MHFGLKLTCLSAFNLIQKWADIVNEFASFKKVDVSTSSSGAILFVKEKNRKIRHITQDLEDLRIQIENVEKDKQKEIKQIKLFFA